MSITTRIRHPLQRSHLVTAIDTRMRDPYAGLLAVPGFRLVSTAVADGETMPVGQRSGIFGAGGDDTSPDLAWSEFPEETQSFIVTMYDPDAPTPSGFWHWVVINIPASVTSLPAGGGDGDETLPDRATHLANDAGLRRYLGAAPPPGDPHRYYIVVSALDVADARVPDGATPARASFQTLAHTIARGSPGSRVWRLSVICSLGWVLKPAPGSCAPPSWLSALSADHDRPRPRCSYTSIRRFRRCRGTSEAGGSLLRRTAEGCPRSTSPPRLTGSPGSGSWFSDCWR